MDKVMILVVLVYWLTSTAYVIHYHYKNGEMEFGVILMALLLGPILAFFIRDDIKKKENTEEHIDNDNHARWFRTRSLIDNQRFSRLSIPPPPPISRVNRALSERDEAIRSARERISKNKIKDFKFFR